MALMHYACGKIWERLNHLTKSFIEKTDWKIILILAKFR